MKTFLKGLGDFANSFRSLFAFYILMYSTPLIIPFSLAVAVKDNIFIDKKDINFGVLIIILCCGFVITLWSLFFLLYLTKERTKNPHLYGKGFVKGFDEATETIDSSKSEKLEQEKVNQEGGVV